MRVLQAGWDISGELIIWGESARGIDLEKGIHETHREGNELADHPFSSSKELLEEDLDLLEFDADGYRTAEIYLPSDDIGPLASPRLLALRERETKGELRLERWSMPTAFLEAAPALAFLTSIPEELPAGLILGDSFKFWLEATKLQLDLLTRGRFVPGIVRKNGSHSAYWHVVASDEEDQRRLKVISDSMPPICRALVQSEAGKKLEPNVLLESFLSQTADALIRTFLRRTELTPEHPPAGLNNKKVLELSWLKALTNEDSEISGSTFELAALEQTLRRWSGPLLPDSKQHTLKPCFRMIAPKPRAGDEELETEPRRWKIEFLLQSLGDPKQIIDAGSIWRGELGFLQRSDFGAEELEDLLLKELARAVHVFPELRNALRDAHPTHLLLETEEAYRFLRETSVLLEQSGFGILLPSWWNQPATQLGLHLEVSAREQQGQHPSRPSLLGMQQLLDYSWQISLGNEVLELNDFKNLVETKAPLVEINGQWVELQPQKVESTLRFLETGDDKKQMRVIDALRIGLGLESDTATLPIVSFNASGWINKLLDAKERHVSTITQPKNLEGELRPYQQQGLSWLAFLSEIGLGGCLADDMGLGKTVQLLALLSHEREFYDEKVAPTLLIVPMSILDNWERECHRFTPHLRCFVHHGPSRLGQGAFAEKAAASDLVVTTYSLAHRDEASLSEVKWHRIALDEAQNIKNLATKQTQAVRRITQAQMVQDENGGACHRVALTGTPLENHLEELWSIFDFLNPGYLGTISDFRSRFAVPIERYRDKTSSETLARLVKPFILRRLKTDEKVIDELPEKLEMDIFTSLTKEQAALYQSVVDNMIPQVDDTHGIHRKGLVLSTITKLKQICNHPTLYLKDNSELADRSGKLARLEELLDVVLAEGDKVLIFTQYAQMGHLLKDHLQERFGREALFLHGALHKNARNKLIDKFQTKEGPPIFILSLKAGGFGLNLTEANQVIHYDQWWNPAVEEQASDRAYRIGQKRNVQVRKFITTGTLEEKIAEMLNRKRDLADNIVGATKSMITELSTDELHQLLRLSAENLGDFQDDAQ